MPRSLSDNFPLYAVGLVLACAFAALALIGGTPPSAQPQTPQTAGRLAQPGPPDFGNLPATGKDTVVLSELAPHDAQARNAAVAYATIGPGTARPFAFGGNSADRGRARDCLALAGMAEAGSGDGDQRAVMQVILNRVRHPAFAKTVCGVVFEGSQRPTGCQFSFTCDGSLARRYSDALWEASRRRADELLGGATYAPVGNATHFHADYVYPWWSDQLDKVAKVGAHIFFRWRGQWGSRNALSVRYGGGEPDPLALQTTAQAVAAANPLPTLLQSGEAVHSIIAEPAAQETTTATTGPASPAPGVHFVLVSSGDAPAALIERARALCPGDRYCQVYGWSESEAIPAKLPLSAEARRQLRFSFLPARQGNAETVYLDCRIFVVTESGRCLPNARP